MWGAGGSPSVWRRGSGEDFTSLLAAMPSKNRGLLLEVRRVHLRGGPTARSVNLLVPRRNSVGERRLCTEERPFAIRGEGVGLQFNVS